MTLELPPAAPVDESRRGVLTINDGGLLALLNIAGHRIEEMRVTASGALQVELVGEDMPEGLLPKPVELLVTQVVVGEERRAFGSWRHKPEKRWRMR
jgi:hypothetical protein